MSDHGTVDQDIILIHHELAEVLEIKRSTHIQEKLGILQVGRELVECLGLTAVGEVQVIELLHVFERCILQFVLYSNGRRYLYGSG